MNEWWMIVLVDVIVALQYGDTALHTSARYGHAGVTRILIGARCDVNECNKVSASSTVIYAMYLYLWHLATSFFDLDFR